MDGLPPLRRAAREAIGRMADRLILAGTPPALALQLATESVIRVETKRLQNPR